ncbi:MAG: HAMP domain-containing histidine kinase [Nitrospirae bacterium]|nr:HAMP domain-containing histidine kinase [Nitrospirota bacterium]MBF0536265.1 HAMP domain-containing histidine kinase [Nitrospirota bacterium]MBF0615801.1 HAMP domain-containing histidine kinase [Nitrospirota bacterium]
MRTKLFLSFATVIIIALISNLIFKWLITKDFNDYVAANETQNISWVVSTVQDAYQTEGNGCGNLLYDAVHWGLMLGLYVEILDKDGNVVMDAKSVFSGHHSVMTRNMEDILKTGKKGEHYKDYPIMVNGSLLASVWIWPITGYGFPSLKENLFKKRGKHFLLISFLIAGGGAIILSVLFSVFLSTPLKRLIAATAKIGSGDFNVSIPVTTRDEIGDLASAFNFMASALRREDEQRKQIMSNIAHELRTPLTIMRANVEAVVDGVADENPGKCHTVIALEVERLTSIVQGIEDVARAEETFFRKPVYEEFTLVPFLRDMIEPFMAQAAQKGIFLTLSDAGNDIKIMGDKEKLSIIFHNLLSNAIKFTEKGGVTLSYEMSEAELIITVKDTGRGISDSEKPLVYNRYYRGKQSGGMGIGLAVVKELADVLNAKVSLQSSEGVGTAFSVRLPLMF